MSGRGSSRNLPHPDPVKKIELSEKHLGWRIAFFILFVIIAVTAFTSGVNALFSSEPGWQEIEVDSSAETNCGNEFVFMYYLGADGRDATVENKALRIIYSDACEMAHKLFHNKEDFAGVNNVHYINQHPNEEIEIDPALYKAFSVINDADNRNLYLGPVYAQYDDIFNCQDDSEIASFDPYLNQEMAEHYKEVAVYANNPEAVKIELLGGNKIRLFVSEEYLSFC